MRAKSFSWPTALVLAAALLPSVAPAQTSVALKNQPPGGAVLGFLLTDGRAFFQGGTLKNWFTLTPDNTGSYVNGTWKRMAPLPLGYVPDAFASAVLADGRVVIAGGEYNHNLFSLTDLCAIYDPVANQWTSFAAPAGWDFIGDSPSAVLPDGRFLLGRKLDMRIAALDPTSLTWTELASTGKADFNAEEGWTLLPNGTILTYDVKNAPNAEIYNPATQVWSSVGSTVANLASPPAVASIKFDHGKMVYHPPGEVGPGILRPDGSFFATGGANKGLTYGKTAIYTPAATGGAGSWAAGPDFPAGDDAGDSFAALLPSGDVLVEGESGELYVFNGTTLTDTKIRTVNDAPLLVLPTGEVLVNGSFVYREAGAANPAWAPVITSAPSVLTPGSSYEITGRQFNGLSQAHAFGDELQTATNYPLLRITMTASGQVIYARTHDHSTMGVATGSTPVSTHFDVPASMPSGAASLQVVANGIASAAVAVTVQ